MRGAGIVLAGLIVFWLIVLMEGMAIASLSVLLVVIVAVAAFIKGALP